MRWGPTAADEPTVTVPCSSVGDMKATESTSTPSDGDTSTTTLGRKASPTTVNVADVPRATTDGVAEAIRGACTARTRMSVVASASPGTIVSLSETNATNSPSPSERSEEHTSELQSLRQLVCRLLLE